MFTVNPGSDKQSIRASIPNMLLRRFQKCQRIPDSPALFAKKGHFFKNSSCFCISWPAPVPSQISPWWFLRLTVKSKI